MIKGAIYAHLLKYTLSKFGLRAGNNLVKEIQLKAPGSWETQETGAFLKSYFWEPQATRGYKDPAPNSLKERGFPIMTTAPLNM